MLNISSGNGRRALACMAAYSTAKAGVDHFARCLALKEAMLPHSPTLAWSRSLVQRAMIELIAPVSTE